MGTQAKYFERKICKSVQENICNPVQVFLRLFVTVAALTSCLI